MDLSQIRQDYRQQLFDIDDAQGDPFEQARLWMADAERAEMPLHNAMTLATTSKDGWPQARVVLLKGITSCGFEFYTNLDSAKAVDLQFEPRASIVLFWPELERQIRVCGTCEQLCRESVERYHATRPRASQISAWASAQSQEVPSRQALEDSWARMDQEFSDKEVPAPPNWGGYLLIAKSFEFWQGRDSRLHDRIVYEQDGEGWSKKRLAP